MRLNSKHSQSFRDQKFMKLALSLARKGSGRVSPNPLVGCVIVKNGKILSQGYHQKFGGAHAEVNALKKISGKARGATMYVTLEPCHHFGKTPPCVDAVIQSGVSRVVIAMQDPNPLTAGKSIKKLKRAGIAVTVGVCGDAAKKLNRFFNKHITTGLPYVIAKVAQSVDGKIAAQKGQRTQITGEKAGRYVQKLREEVDAVLVGKNTVQVDDPLLNVRDPKKPQPRRVILDSRLTLVQKIPHLKILNSQGGPVIFVTVLSPAHTRVKKIKSLGCDVLHVNQIKGHVDLRDMLCQLGKLGVTSILVEGGQKIFTAFAKARLVDEWQVLVSPVILGEKGLNVFDEMITDIEFSGQGLLGEDLLLTGRG